MSITWFILFVVWRFIGITFTIIRYSNSFQLCHRSSFMFQALWVWIIVIILLHRLLWTPVEWKGMVLLLQPQWIHNRNSKVLLALCFCFVILFHFISLICLSCECYSHHCVYLCTVASAINWLTISITYTICKTWWLEAKSFAIFLMT